MYLPDSGLAISPVSAKSASTTKESEDELQGASVPWRGQTMQFAWLLEWLGPSSALTMGGKRRKRKVGRRRLGRKGNTDK